MYFIRQKGLVLIFYVFLSLLFTYPAILRFNTHIIGDGGDNLLYYSYYYLGDQNIQKGNPIFGPNQSYRFPFGVDLSFTEVKSFTYFGILLESFMDKKIAYNLLVFLLFFLNGYCSFLFFKKLSLNIFVGVLGSLINGYSFWILCAGYGSLSSLYAFILPVYGLIFLNISESGIRQVDYVKILLLTSFAITGSHPLVFLSLFSGIVFLGILLILSRNRLQKLNWYVRQLWNDKLLILFLILFFIGFYTVIYPNHINKMLFNKSSGATLFNVPGLPLKTYILPPINYYHSVVSEIIKNFGLIYYIEPWINESFYIGLPTLILLVSVFVRRSKSMLLQAFLIIVTVFGSVLFSTLFYKPMSINFLPPLVSFILGYFTNGYLVIVLFIFFASCSIVLSLKDNKLGNTFVIGCILLLIFERLNTGYPLTDVSKYLGSYTDYVMSQKGSAVFDMPTDVYGEYNLLPFYYHKPIVGGFIHWMADGAEQRKILHTPEFSRFSCIGDTWLSPQPYRINIDNLEEINRLNLKFLDTLKQYNILTIVIHLNRFAGESCEDVRKQASTIFQLPWKKINTDQWITIKYKYLDDNVIIYQLN